MRGSELEVAIATRGSARQPVSSPVKVQNLAPAEVKNGVTPFCRYVNVMLSGMECAEGVTGSQLATVLLENPSGQFVLSADELAEQVGAADNIFLNI